MDSLDVIIRYLDDYSQKHVQEWTCPMTTLKGCRCRNRVGRQESQEMRCIFAGLLSNKLRKLRKPRTSKMKKECEMAVDMAALLTCHVHRYAARHLVALETQPKTPDPSTTPMRRGRDTPDSSPESVFSAVAGGTPDTSVESLLNSPETPQRAKPRAQTEREKHVVFVVEEHLANDETIKPAISQFCEGTQTEDFQSSQGTQTETRQSSRGTQTEGPEAVTTMAGKHLPSEAGRDDLDGVDPPSPTPLYSSQAVQTEEREKFPAIEKHLSSEINHDQGVSEPTSSKCRLSKAQDEEHSSLIKDVPTVASTQTFEAAKDNIYPALLQELALPLSDQYPGIVYITSTCQLGFAYTSPPPNLLYSSPSPFRGCSRVHALVRAEFPHAQPDVDVLRASIEKWTRFVLLPAYDEGGRLSQRAQDVLNQSWRRFGEALLESLYGSGYHAHEPMVQNRIKSLFKGVWDEMRCV